MYVTQHLGDILDKSGITIAHLHKVLERNENEDQISFRAHFKVGQDERYGPTIKRGEKTNCALHA